MHPYTTAQPQSAPQQAQAAQPQYQNAVYPQYQNAVYPQYQNAVYPQNTYAQNSLLDGWFAYRDAGYVKGLLLGAGLAYVLTNPKVQRALVKGAVTLWSTVQGGFEEMKEQIQDIKSEMSMESHDSE